MPTNANLLAAGMRRGQHEAYGIIRTFERERARRLKNLSRTLATVYRGDDGRYWVATGAVADLLAGMGYEKVEF